MAKESSMPASIPPQAELNAERDGLVSQGVSVNRATQMVREKYGITPGANKEPTQGASKTSTTPSQAELNAERDGLVSNGVSVNRATQMVREKYGITPGANKEPVDPPAVVTKNAAYDEWKKQYETHGRGRSWTRDNFLDKVANDYLGMRQNLVRGNFGVGEFGSYGNAIGAKTANIENEVSRINADYKEKIDRLAELEQQAQTVTTAEQFQAIQDEYNQLVTEVNYLAQYSRELSTEANRVNTDVQFYNDRVDKIVSENKDPSAMNDARLAWEQAEEAARQAKLRMNSLQNDTMSGGAGGATPEMYKAAELAAEAYRLAREQADALKQQYQERQSNYYAVTAMRGDLGTVTPPEEQPMWNPAYGRVNPMAVTQNLEADRNTEFLTEDEQAVYNYILATQGKEAADDFVSYMQESLNYRAGLARSDEIESRGRFGQFLGRTGTSITSGLASGVTGIGDVFTGEARPTSEWEYAQMFNSERAADDGIQVRSEEYKELLRERRRLAGLVNKGQNEEANRKKLNEVEAQIQAMEAAGTDREAWKIAGRSTAQIWNDVINNAGNQAMSFALGTINPVLGITSLGVSAAGNAKQEKLREGWDAADATTYGVLVGAAESALSKVLGGVAKFGGKKSLANTFTRNVDKIDNTFARFLSNGAGHAIPEFTEEFIQTYLAPAFEAVILNTDYENPGFEEALYSGLIGALYSIPMNMGGVRSTTAERATLNTPTAVPTAPTVNTQTQTEVQRFTAPQVSPNANAEAQLYDILFGGRISNTQATDIANNPVYRQIFAEMGIDLGGMTTVEQRRAVQNKAREMAYQQSQYQQSNGLGGLVENARQNRANAEQSRNAAQEAAQYEQAVRDSGLESYVRGLYLEGMNYTNAKEIYDNPTLRAAFESMSGTSLEGMSRANAVEVIRATDLSDYLLPELQPQTAQGSLEGTQISTTAPNASTAQSDGFNQAQTDTATALIQDGIANGFDMEVMVDIAFEPELQDAFQAATGESINFAAFPNTDEGRFRAVADAVKRYEQGGAKAQPLDTVQLVADMATGREPGTSTVTPAPRQNAVQGVVDDVVNAAVQARVPSAQTVSDSNLGQGRGRTTQTAATITNADITSEQRASQLGQYVANGTFDYTPDTNKAQIERATESIQNDGWEASALSFAKDVAAGKSGKDLVARGAVLLNNISNSNASVDSYMDVVNSYVELLHRAGETLQAGKIVQQLTPEGRLYLIGRTVSNINNSLTNSQRKSIAKDQGIDTQSIETAGVKLDQGLVDAYMNAKTDAERDGIIDQIQQSIADQIPATFSEKLTAFRYTAMLGNFKTQVRNITGNALSLVTKAAKDRIAGIIEGAVASNNPNFERTRTWRVDGETRKRAWDDFAQYREVAKGEKKYDTAGKNLSSGIESKRKIFKSNLLEGYRNATQWAMEMGDEIFLRAAYADSMAMWLTANGVNMDTATESQLDRARRFAIKEAQEATFRDRNQVSDMVSSIGVDLKNKDNGVAKVAGAAIEGVVPFKRTPANVLVRAEEYSPLGIANAIYQAANVKNGKYTINDVINSATKAGVGSALCVAGYFLAAAGRMRGLEDDKELDKAQKAAGAQDWSYITEDGKYISISQFSPAAVPLLMGTRFFELTRDTDIEPKDFLSVLAESTAPMIEMSMLQGINNAFAGLSSYGDDSDAFANFIGNALLSFANQFLPSLVGQMEQASEQNRQSIYTNKNNEYLGTDAQYAIGKALNRLPGFDYQSEDYVDMWGRTQSNGDAVERIFNAFINPTYSSENREEPIDIELQRLHEATKDLENRRSVFPSFKSQYTNMNNEGQQMTREEYNQYRTSMGQRARELVSDFIDSPEYKDLTDEQRMNVISNLYDLADAQAIKEVKSGMGMVGEEIKTDQDSLLILKDPAAYLANMAMAKDYIVGQGGTFDAGSAEFFKILLDSDMSDKDIQTLSKNMSQTQQGYYNELRDLYPTQKANDIFKALEIDSNGSDWKKAQEIANNGELSEDDVLAILGVYNPANETKNDPSVGKKKEVVQRYEHAMNNGLTAKQWAAIEKAAFDYDATSGNKSGTPNKDEITAAMTREFLQENGIPLLPDAIYDLWRFSTNEKKTSVDQYVDITPKEEKAKEPEKPKLSYKDYKNRKKAK